MRQRKISKNTGNDTHVRNQYENKFKTQSHGTYLMLAGEIEFPQPEPIFKQNLVTVKFARGGRVSTVAYPGAFVAPLTGNIHGIYEGPIPGQMVMVGFENGNSAAPFVINRYPYQGAADTAVELDYITPLTKARIDPQDVVISHFAGSSLRFSTGGLSGKEPGAVSLNVVSSLDVAANFTVEIDSGLAMTFKSALSGQVEIGTGVSITGAAAHTIESDLSGAISVGALLKIENAAHNLGTLIAGLITTLQAAVTIPAVVGSPLTLDPAFIALLEAEKLKFALLLE